MRTPATTSALPSNTIRNTAGALPSVHAGTAEIALTTAYVAVAAVSQMIARDSTAPCAEGGAR